MRIKILAPKTGYWRPGTRYLELILTTITNLVAEGDIITISEKAISTSLGNILDEIDIAVSRLAFSLAKLWMRIVWGYFLGFIARMDSKNILRIRGYPISEGSRHKQLCLWKTGFLNSLKHWSEGGIDASNLPLSLVSLPLKNANQIAKTIKQEIRSKLGKNVIVLIVDSDKTFTFQNLHLSSRSTNFKGIYNLGPFAFILGRALKLRPRSTPIGTSDRIDVNQALNLAAASNRARGSGAGRTVWDVSTRFNQSITKVTWEMLDSVEHRPIILIRLRPKAH
jgi:F420-0:gamma-glutamyl ligase-like protein